MLTDVDVDSHPVFDCLSSMSSGLMKNLDLSGDSCLNLMMDFVGVTDA